LAVGGWRLAVGGWLLAFGGWWLAFGVIAMRHDSESYREAICLS